MSPFSLPPARKSAIPPKAPDSIAARVERDLIDGMGKDLPAHTRPALAEAVRLEAARLNGALAAIEAGNVAFLRSILNEPPRDDGVSRTVPARALATFLRPLALRALVDDVGDAGNLRDGFLLAEGTALPLCEALLVISQVNEYLAKAGYMPTHNCFDRRRLSLFRGGQNWEAEHPPICDGELLVRSIKKLTVCHHRQTAMEIDMRASLTAVSAGIREFFLRTLQVREAALQKTIFSHLDARTPASIRKVGLVLPCDPALFVTRSVGPELPRQIQTHGAGKPEGGLADLSKGTAQLRRFHHLAIVLAEIDEGLSVNTERLKTDLRDLRRSREILHSELLDTSDNSPLLAERAGEYVRLIFAHHLLEEMRSKPDFVAAQAKKQKARLAASGLTSSGEPKPEFWRGVAALIDQYLSRDFGQDIAQALLNHDRAFLIGQHRGLEEAALFHGPGLALELAFLTDKPSATITLPA